jgi:streptomycin 6-kinase
LRAEFDGDTGPFPVRIVEEAETLAAELFRTAAPPVVLHGDLHHFNILAGERQPWLAIDPKGVLGEPAYEIGAWMRNWPLGSADPVPRLERRLDLFAAGLGVDRPRLRAWTIAQGVLSAWWDYDARRKTIGARPLAMLEYFARLRE